MPQAKVLARGTMPAVSVNMSAILDDTELGAQQIGEYAVWQKPLSDFKPAWPSASSHNIEPFPSTVNITIALSGAGSFLFGAEGPEPDILSVFGTLYWGSWGETMTANEHNIDEGIFEPADIALVAIGYRELTFLKNRGYISGIPDSTYAFRKISSISVRHKLSKPVWVVYYPVFIFGYSEYEPYAYNYPINQRWSQFQDPRDNGTAQRALNLEYTGAVSSYVYCVAYNNNGEESWVKLDQQEIVHKVNWGLQARKLYNTYPAAIELGAIKTWSMISPAVTLTVLADSVDVISQTEFPSLGKRKSPPPDILALPPNLWIGIGEFKTSQESTLTETIIAKKAILNNAQATGDFTTALNFTNLEIISITTGPFAGKGFSKGEFETTSEGTLYKGNWQGLLYLKPQERKIYLKGSVSGEISATAEGSLTESIPQSGIYDKYQMLWNIGRMGNTTTSATIILDGQLSYQSSLQFPDTTLYILQANIEGTILGDYNIVPASTVLTHIRVKDQTNPYYGEGFSIISYTSDQGQGEGWTYDKEISQGRVELTGLFTSPLLGILSATLDETTQPKTLSLSIERTDLGLPPAPDLKVRVWGPERVSPGQTIDYIIEYRNDGLKEAIDISLLVHLPVFCDYLTSSANSRYYQVLNMLRWDIPSIPAKSAGQFYFKIRMEWGIPEGTGLSTGAFLIPKDKADLRFEFFEREE